MLIIDLLNTYANLGQTENTSRFKDFAKRLEGWNSTLLYKDDYDNQIIESVIPKSEEIVLTKNRVGEVLASPSHTTGRAVLASRRFQQQ